MAVYYLSPTGDDNNNGSDQTPWFTLHKAYTVVQPNDVVYLRGGILTME